MGRRKRWAKFRTAYVIGSVISLSQSVAGGGRVFRGSVRVVRFAEFACFPLWHCDMFFFFFIETLYKITVITVKRLNYYTTRFGVTDNRKEWREVSRVRRMDVILKGTWYLSAKKASLPRCAKGVGKRRAEYRK